MLDRDAPAAVTQIQKNGLIDEAQSQVLTQALKIYAQSLVATSSPKIESSK